MPISVLVWVRSFIAHQIVLENNVPFDNTTPIYLINLLWIRYGLRLDSELHYFSIFLGE